MRLSVLFILSGAALALVLVPLTAYSKIKKKDAQNAQPAEVEEVIDPYFDDLQWRARVLVVTGNYRDSRTKRQLDELRKDLGGLKKRNVAVIRFVTDSIYEMEEFSDYGFHDQYDMNAHQQRYVETSIDGDNNVFSVMLFGKDGEKKLEWTPDEVEGQEEKILPLTAIFSAIDSMPMEQKKKK